MAPGKTTQPAAARILRSPLDRGFCRQQHQGPGHVRATPAPASKPAAARMLICLASGGSSGDHVSFRKADASSRFETKKTIPPIVHSSGHCKQFDYIVIGSGIAGWLVGGDLVVIFDHRSLSHSSSFFLLSCPLSLPCQASLMQSRWPSTALWPSSPRTQPARGAPSMPKAGFALSSIKLTRWRITSGTPLLLGPT